MSDNWLFDFLFCLIFWVWVVFDSSSSSAHSWIVFIEYFSFLFEIFLNSSSYLKLFSKFKSTFFETISSGKSFIKELSIKLSFNFLIEDNALNLFEFLFKLFIMI